MPVFQADPLKQIGQRVFQAAGATTDEARIVSEALVNANLVGHDSHGVMRIPEYVRWMEQNLITIGAHIRVVREAESFAIVDGGWGFGQVIGREAAAQGECESRPLGRDRCWMRILVAVRR